VNLRQNSIQIDGAQSGDLFGIGTTGQPGASANAKSIPLDAVKEYQVLLSPFDVRQGSFGGLLINAITKSVRTSSTAACSPTRATRISLGTSPTSRTTSKRSTAAAWADRSSRTACSSSAAASSSSDGCRRRARSSVERCSVAQSSIDQLNQILSSKYGFNDGGTGDQVQRDNPNKNIFGRIDAYLPLNTRLVLRHNYAYADNITFGRSARPRRRRTSR
jgi:hypothetical protein